jgi:Rrf2 family cysteine metabolism transcriptional repressor
MELSQRTQYAVRAVFELAKRRGQGPVRIAEVAKAQAIPRRFLEVILGELKQAGFVESRRGSQGGYVLGRSPDQLTVAEVIEFLQGPLGPVACLSDESAAAECPLRTCCVFRGMWEQVREAVSNVYKNTTFSDLVKRADEPG